MDKIEENIGYINRAIQEIDSRLADIEKKIANSIPTRTIYIFLSILSAGIFAWLSTLTAITIKTR